MTTPSLPPLPELPFFRYERHEVRMFLLDYAAAAYRAGQVEMRERAAEFAVTWTGDDGLGHRIRRIRALPVDA
jgi:hypothetical protein